MIKNVIFDWGGVVLTLDKDLCIKNFADVAGVPDFNEYLTLQAKALRDSFSCHLVLLLLC